MTSPLLELLDKAKELSLRIKCDNRQDSLAMTSAGALHLMYVIGGAQGVLEHVQRVMHNLSRESDRWTYVHKELWQTCKDIKRLLAEP